MVIEATTRQLAHWVSFRADGFEDSLSLAYAQMRLSALQGELQGGWEQFQGYADLDEESQAWFQSVYQIRKAIISRKVSADSLHMLRSSTEKMDPIFQGESYCLLAMAESLCKDYQTAKDSYQQAYQVLKTAGASIKALTALQNQIAMQSQIHPEKRLIAEYNHLADEAERIGAHTVAGIAWLNLSREYQLVDSLQFAMQVCERAVSRLNSDTGSQHYYLALLHYGHLLIQHKEWEQLRLVMDQIRVAPFPSVLESLKVLEVIRTGQNQVIDKELLTETWLERLEMAMESPNIQFGDMEQSLIQALIVGAKSKADLIHQLFGSRLDFEVLDNRFRNLLARVRKKCPGLIIFRNGLYSVSSSEDASRLVLPVENRESEMFFKS